MPERIFDSNADRQRAYRARQQAARETTLHNLTSGARSQVAPPMPTKKRWNVLLAEARRTLETAASEMQDYYDERTDRWKESEKANEMENTISEIQSAIDTLEAIEL